MKRQDKIMKSLEDLVSSPGYIYAASLINRKDFFYSPDEALTINWHERLHQNELTLLYGLLIKRELNLSFPTKTEVEGYIGDSYKLLREFQSSFTEEAIKRMADPAKKKKEFGEIFGSGDLMVEPIFYAETGAYDFQYWELSPSRYKHDAEWMRKNLGIDMQNFVEISKFLKDLVLKNANRLKPSSAQPKDIMKTALDIFCIEKEDLEKNFDNRLVDRFLDLFSIVPGKANKSFKKPGEYNEVESRPLIQLGGEKYYFTSGFTLARSIYESPYYWMLDDKKYKDQLFKNRGTTTVEMAKKFLLPVFGNGNVYQDVIIESKKGQHITDIDLLATGGNKAVVFQAKSKKLTVLSRKGDTLKLKNDFNEAIQEAYTQGLKARSSLLGGTIKTLKENGKPIRLKEPLDDIYLVCLVGDHYPAIQFQTRSYLKKGSDDPYPLTISLFDLELLTHYLPDPLDFLYYLRQRINTAEDLQAGGEVAYLSFHLKHKLFFDSKGVDKVMLTEDFAQYIDANFPVAKGYYPAGKDVDKLFHEWRNEDFNRLVQQVKKSRDTGFTDAIFMLYDLSGDAADQLIELIKKVKTKTKADGKLHSFATTYGTAGVSYVCVPKNQENNLSPTLLSYSMARKYKSKADTWLGMGSVIDSPRLVDEIVFNNDPWEYDKRLENLSSVVINPGTVINPLKNVGRNDPCVCGSGIKYKKCCGRTENKSSK